MAPRAMEMLSRTGVQFVVEAGAGEAAGFRDSEFEQRAARIAQTREEMFAAAEAIVLVRALGANPVAGRADLPYVRAGQLIIGFCEPLTARSEAEELAERGASTLAMELMPRITRAQSMDALSSMATIAGYKAALLAANELPRMFPMLMTAAGTVAPARVFVLGAGVADGPGHARTAVVVGGDRQRPAAEHVEVLAQVTGGTAGRPQRVAPLVVTHGPALARYLLARSLR
jgi:NAD(P) transhydrogenase subunit alpha